MDVRTFLNEFKRERRFETVLPRMAADEAFRTALLREIASGEYPYAEYSSWIAQHFFKKHPELLPEWIPFMKEILLSTSNHSLQRNLTHLFIHKPVPISEDGELLNLFLAFLESPTSLPALKFTSFYAIEKQYFKAYPELIPEVGHLLHLHKDDQRPSVQSIRRYFDKKYKTSNHA